MSERSNRQSPVAELASLFAAAYVRLLSQAEKACNDAVFAPENQAFPARNPLDSRTETRTPCVGDGRHKGAR